MLLKAVVQLDQTTFSTSVLLCKQNLHLGIQTLWRQMRLSCSTNRGRGSAGINAHVEKHNRPLTQHAIK